MKVFQIYFQESQKESLDPLFTPYFNEGCTPFFESSVIRSLIELGAHKGHEYFGVVSYKLTQKIGHMRTNWRNHPHIADKSVREFTVERYKELLYLKKPDAMSFQCHAPHDTVTIANNFHPNFIIYWKKIMDAIGFAWEPVIIQDVFYCNYFCAKSELYERFVKEMLAPAMDFMEKQMPELWTDSKYPKALPQNLSEAWKINHFPYHAFLCERMFSYWAHLNKLTCLHY